MARVIALGLALVAAGPAPRALADEAETAVFAAGCFWSTEAAFEGLPGVLSVISGFTGGDVENPSYKEVTRGQTGHREAVEVRFDPAKTTYEKLLDVFWHNVDPVTKNGQFCDFGDQYRSAIFVRGDAQRKAAEVSRLDLEETNVLKGLKIQTDILPAAKFWPAEPYHQDFVTKNPDRYEAYANGCGRAQRLERIWGKDARRGPVAH